MYEHELFRHLLTNKIYIDINQISCKLNKFVYKNNAKNILIVYGRSGIGKSTILAYFDKNQRETNKEKNNLIISRYIGITIQSNTIILLLISIIHELYDKYSELKQEINDKHNEYDENDIYDVIDHLYKLFEKILNIYAHKFIIIIFDSINQFFDKKQELQFLNFMITNSNPKIKIILSTSNNKKIVSKYNKNNVEITSVDKMNKDEILMFIKQYLCQYGKVFDENQKSMILDHYETVCNPLFLSIFLEEMRCFGSFENLNEYISSYINVNSISKLFEKIMCRLQNEFEKNDNILKHTLCLLYISRNGLLPNELQLCLEYVMNVSKIEKTFPIFEYSSLIHQLINLHFIKQISGKYTIIHQFINDAIHSKYFQQNDTKIIYLQAIYKSFIQIYNYNHSITSNQRFIGQVPYCLYTLINEFNKRDYKDVLKNIIADIECIKYMKLPENMYDFHKYWNIIQDETSSIYKCFSSKLNDLIVDNDCSKMQIANYYHDIAIFMIDTGRYYDNIEYFLTQSLKYYDDNKLQTESIIFELGKLYQKQNEFNKSLSQYEKCVDILQNYIQNDNHDDNEKELKLKLLIRQSALAGIQKELNEWNDAIKTYELCLKNKMEILDDNNPLIAIDMINIANTYIVSNKNKYLEKAEDLGFAAKKIFENNFGSDCLQLSMVYSLLGFIYQFKKKYNLSIKYLKTAKDIKINKLGSTNIDMVQCLNNLGNVYLKIDEMDKSLTCFNDAYNLMLINDKNDKNKLILCHNNLSNYYLINKQYDLALQHLIECKDIIQETFGENCINLIDPLLNLANIYNGTIKDYESAQNIYQQILSIIDENKLQNKLIKNCSNIQMECFNGLSHLYLNHYTNYDKTIEYLDKQLNIIQSMNDELKEIDILHDKVAAFIAQKDYLKAWSTLKQILTNFKFNEKLIITYNLCGNVMFQLNRQNDAISYYEKQLKLIKCIDDECLDLIQLLAILHFGNENLLQSKKYFQVYMEHCNNLNKVYDTEQMNMWLNDIKEAETLLSV